MLLGKRPRPPMRRTASMTGMTFDRVPQEPSDDGPPNAAGAATPAEHAAASPRDHPDFISATPTNRNSIDDDGSYSYDHRNYVAATADMASPGSNPHGTVEHMEMAQFLRICWLCRRSLVPGRDIYMYRGDTAFCSLECREQQMKKDERKEKRA